MMRLWEEDGPLAEAYEQPKSWRVPRLIRRERGTQSDLLISDKPDESSILLLEDLGETLNLARTVESWAKSPPPSTSLDVTELVSRVGRILGTSLAMMHSQQTALAVESRPEISRVLSQNLTDDVVWFIMMEPLPELLANVPNGKGKVYFDRLAKDMKTPQYEYPTCLVHGDFNFGNILFPVSPSNPDDPRPYLIDWEFANNVGRGVNGDISEFLSLLHCRLISARRQTDQHTLSDLLRRLLHSFCGGYAQRAALNCKMERSDVNSQLYRSALLLSGRDIIVFAHDNCTDDEGFDDMIRIGLWYLEHAGDDMDEFLSEENREALRNEDEGLIRSLFIFVDE